MGGWLRGGVRGCPQVAACIDLRLADSWPHCTCLQVRTEAMGAVLSAVCMAAPTLEQRLKERRPGRGRGALPDTLPCAASCFAIRSGLPDSVKQVGGPRTAVPAHLNGGEGVYQTWVA